MPELDPFINGTENAPLAPPPRLALPPGLMGSEDRAGVETYKTPTRLRRPDFAVPRPGAEIPPELAARLVERRREAAALAAAQTAAPVQVAPAALGISHEDGQVRAHLPFALDVERLTHWLTEHQYFCAHMPGDGFRAGSRFPNSQGWGPEHDPGSYYPYWVYPDPEHRGRSLFAFNPQPEDVVQKLKEGHTTTWVDLGDKSKATLKEWLPVLAAHARGTTPGRPG